MDDSNLNLPIEFVIATTLHQENRRGQDSEMSVIINRYGINLMLKSSEVGATSETILWKHLVQGILATTPNLFGDLTDPYHLGFKQALDDIGIVVGGNSS